MALQSDRDGFLVGEPITIDRGDFGRAMQIWKGLQKDVGDIRKALAGDIVKAINKQERSARQGSNASTPARGPDGRFVRKTPSNPTVALPESNRRPAKPKAADSAAVPTRGADGRFRGGNGDDKKPDPRDDDDDSPSAARRAAEAVGESVKSGLSEAMSGVDQVDPAIAAAKEMHDIAGPLLKPVGALGKLFAGGDKEEKEKRERNRWYKRVWDELREISGKTGVTGGGLSLSGLSGLLLKLPGISILGFVLTKLAPLVGKLAAPVAAIISAAKSFTTSTEEYAKRLGVDLNGSLAQELGVRFVGVLGDLGNTLTFGLAGKFGETVAPAISDAIIDTQNYIKEKWGAAADFITNTWAAITGKISDAKGAVTGAASSAKSWAADKIDQGKSLLGGGSEGNKRALLQQMDAAGITDPAERAMFMAQMDHESGGFRSMEENLNYSASGLMKTFPKHYKSEADAKRDAGNPQAIASKVYGGRLGNTEEGDGYRYRGRGMTQLTGKANYAEAGAALGIDLVNNPDLAAQPDIAAKIATWYWQSKGIGTAAKKGDVKGATRMINGGLNGLADRQAKYSGYLAAGTATSALPARSSAAPAIDRLTPAPAAPVATQIGSNDKGGSSQSVTIPMVIGQNMSDRSIAHVATGGMASGMGS